MLVRDLAEDGIIPAYAGSTRIVGARWAILRGSSPHTRGAPVNPMLCSRSLRDHPRIRGEHEREHDRLRYAYGIIPAYAGSTCRCGQRGPKGQGSSPHTRGALHNFQAEEFDIRDHPRIRGEHVCREWQGRSADGIIPAYAGSTTSETFVSWFMSGSSPHTRGAPRLATHSSTTCRDHPRIRGEHRHLLKHLLGFDGIIPAYAGSTPCPLRRRGG